MTFANRSDRVRMFLDEMTAPDQHGITRKDLYSAFKVWGSDTAGPTDEPKQVSGPRPLDRC